MYLTRASEPYMSLPHSPNFCSPLTQTESPSGIFFFLSSPKDMFTDFRERGRERETLMWERNISQLPPIHTPTRNGTRNLGMCPDQEWNPQPFGIWDNAQTSWATQPGLNFEFYINDLFAFLHNFATHMCNCKYSASFWPSYQWTQAVWLCV